MSVTYDRASDAAFTYLRPIERGGVQYSYQCEPSQVGDSWIVLDFDSENWLIGIEVLDASEKLPPSLVAQAEIIG